MKHLYLTLLLLLPLRIMAETSISIIPAPQKCVERKGHFTVNEKTVIMFPEITDSLLDAVDVWRDLFATAAGYTPEVTAGKTSSNVIRCVLNPTLAEEAYRLNVSTKSIQIEAGTAKGIFYAFQTLRQLLPPAIEGSARVEDARWEIPCVSIEDSPSFFYRGMMLDVSRHFVGKEDVKRYIDLLAFHKMNVFHWHLTDDQGWRIEIKKYPKLAKTGGWRNKTIKGLMWDNPTEWNTERYGGFYTQEDVKEVVEYAKKRFVEVIPEIEMPGHCVAALAAYPEYSCSGGPFEVEGRWGVFNDIFCTKEKTFQFLQDILDEVTSLFPSEYIHLGGDEAPRIRWKNCVHCQNRMRQEKLDTEAELQTYFMNRIENYLNGKGKKIIGWDEILEGGIPQRATVMSWRGESGGIKAAQAGYDVIMTPNVYMYLNCHQLGAEDSVGFKKRLISLEKVYNYNPVPSVLKEKEAAHIKGVQANLWTEYLVTIPQMDYSLFPRLAAVAEIAWSRRENMNYDRFCIRLEKIKRHYDGLGVAYCPRIYNRKNKEVL